MAKSADIFITFFNIWIYCQDTGQIYCIHTCIFVSRKLFFKNASFVDLFKIQNIQSVKEFLTYPAPLLSTVLIKDIMAVSRLTSFL